MKLPPELAGRPTVLYAYPADFTPGCTLEAQDFARLHSQFMAAGWHVAGISPDSEAKHAKFCEAEHLPFALISDPDKKLLAELGAWGEKKNYGKAYLGVIRSTFLLDAAGTVVHAWRNVKAKGHAEKVLAYVQSL